MMPRWGDLVRELASGAAGVVLLVRLRDGQLAVEKHARADNPWAASLLRAEAFFLRLYGRVKGVIRMFAADLAGPAPAILLEYADGGSLVDVLNTNGALDPAFVAYILRSIAESLVEPHANEHIHRDIKPDNILFVGDAVKLADFSHAHGAEKSCGTFQVAGTKGYMAPEALVGEAVPKSDIYSLSIVGRQALLGKHPGAKRDLRSVAAGVDPRLAALVWWMSEARPDDRPSAEEVLHVLDGALEPPAMPEQFWTPNVIAAVAVGGVVLVVGAGVGIWWLVRKSATSSREE